MMLHHEQYRPRRSARFDKASSARGEIVVSDALNIRESANFSACETGLQSPLLVRMATVEQKVTVYRTDSVSYFIIHVRPVCHYVFR